MAARHLAAGEPLLPTEDIKSNADELLRHLSNASGHARFVLSDKQTGIEIELNEDVFEIFRQALIDLSQNRAVQIAPISTELTTVQAAEFLKVSRPHLIKLLEENAIPFRKVGTHRRVELRALMDYAQRMKRDSREASREMSREAQELGLDF
ncbi:MAG: helix-turn-helix domain-containing protein [Pseudomonadota bacterium]